MKAILYTKMKYPPPQKKKKKTTPPPPKKKKKQQKNNNTKLVDDSMASFTRRDTVRQIKLLFL